MSLAEFNQQVKETSKRAMNQKFDTLDGHHLVHEVMGVVKRCEKQHVVEEKSQAVQDEMTLSKQP